MNNKNNKNPVCHLKHPLFKDSGVDLLITCLNKYKKLKLKKYTQNSRKIDETIELKLFSGILNHEIMESNKKTFNKRLN